jgi:replicative DNA helicase
MSRLEVVRDSHDDASIAIERCALGCVLERSDLLGNGGEDLESTFLSSDHRAIWRAMVQLHNEGIVIDPPLVSMQSGVDVIYVAGLMYSGYVLENFRTYIARIRGAARERRFRRLADELPNAADSDRSQILEQLMTNAEPCTDRTGIANMRHFTCIA